ncbi:MAG TPA: protease modulator HflC [Candidatus Dormibacteraeota bacterium]|nr:protease modulator HflC [Candidatus Dormibacteraeota bacterium]
MKSNPLIVFIGVLLIAIVALLLFTFQVRQSEVAVVTTFGKPTRPIIEPGLKAKLPWPIQKVYKFDQRIQNFEDPVTENLTHDSFNLLTSVYVGWKITKPEAFFPKFAGGASPITEAEQSLKNLLLSAKSAIVGKHPLSDFVSATDNGTNFVAIENEIFTAIESQVKANNYGLEIEFLGLKKLQLPEQVTQTVFDRMTSERKVLADKSQFEGEAEAQKIRSDADRKAAEILAKAQGEATRIRGEAEAKAAESLSVFQRNPGLANFIFRLDALEGSLKEKSILIFDRRTPPFDLFTGASTNLLDLRK